MKRLKILIYVHLFVAYFLVIFGLIEVLRYFFFPNFEGYQYTEVIEIGTTFGFGFAMWFLASKNLVTLIEDYLRKND